MDTNSVLFILFLFCLGVSGGFIGRMKGGSFSVWFLISFCIPFLGVLTALLMRPENEELRRECPGCGKIVKLHDALCTSCGTELEFPDVALASEASLRRRTA
jgi:hypothetical protein